MRWEGLALEMLVKAFLELPGFSTLDELASRLRREVNTGKFERVDGRIGLPERVGLELSTRQGREAWLRAARHRVDDQRAKEAWPIPHSRQKRLTEAKRRLEEDLAAECAANTAYEEYRAHGRMKDGRRFGGAPKPYQPPETPAGRINVTDLDSRNVKTRGGYIQGYNAQAAVTAQQIVIAAEISVSSPDFGLLKPVVKAARAELAKVGVTDTPGVLVADAEYWHQVQMQHIVDEGIQVLVPPDAGNRQGNRPGWDGGLYAFMRRVLDTNLGGDLYRKRKGMIEPFSATPSTTAAPTASNDAAAPPCAPNGDCSPPPTTSSNSTHTSRPSQPPDRTPGAPKGLQSGPGAVHGATRHGVADHEPRGRPSSAPSRPKIQARRRPRRV